MGSRLELVDERSAIEVALAYDLVGAAYGLDCGNLDQFG